jgi:hypothetical protein
MLILTFFLLFLFEVGGNTLLTDVLFLIFNSFINSLQGLEPFKEKETAKLLRMVHDALNESGYRLDIEKLYRDFQSVDNKRETLSKAQVRQSVKCYHLPQIKKEEKM